MHIATVRQRIPWQAKVVAKLLLARMPMKYSAWRRMSIFRHGAMHTAEYAWSILSQHLGEYMMPNGLCGKTVLELGPGDGITSGLLTSLYGAEHTTLIDVGTFATRDLSHYRSILNNWKLRGLDVSALLECSTFEDLCNVGRTTYLTAGLDSLREVEPNSVDMMFSNAVLEHVRRAEFRETIEELWRIIREGGRSSHGVDLGDHLGNALNNLRFSDSVWESRLLANSGFYTNRIRFGEMCEVFSEVGFEIEVPRTWEWDRLPTPRRKLHRGFRSLPDSDLLVSAFDLVARKAVEGPPPAAPGG